MTVIEPTPTLGGSARAHRGGTSPRTSSYQDFDSGLAVRTVESAGHTRAAVAGELDLATAPTAGDILTDCLVLSPAGLDVDLGDVAFFDCAGLNMLLRLRARALDLGVELAISALSPSVARVLDLSGTRELFASPTRTCEARVVRPARPA
ncbi:STAS domain-containing protein [Actinacidiphila sp. bgisy144]